MNGTVCKFVAGSLLVPIGVESIDGRLPATKDRAHRVDASADNGHPLHTDPVDGIEDGRQMPSVLNFVSGAPTLWVPSKTEADTYVPIGL